MKYKAKLGVDSAFNIGINAEDTLVLAVFTLAEVGFSNRTATGSQHMVINRIGLSAMSSGLRV